MEQEFMVYDTVMKLKVTHPEEFRPMPEADKNMLHFPVELSELCLKDPERQMILTAGAKEAGLFGSMGNVQGAAKDMEKRICKALKSMGYTLEGFFDRTACGENGSGFRYRCSLQGVAMYGEVCAIRRNKATYYLQILIPEPAKEAGSDVWEKVLARSDWKR